MTSLFMTPHKDYMTNHGIGQVVRAMDLLLPPLGFEFTDDYHNADVAITHAGEAFANRLPDVSICHGLYPTGVPHYVAKNPSWQRNRTSINHDVIFNLVVSDKIIVPSEWVAEILRRDMHLNPHVISWGVHLKEWEHNEPNEGYALWNKNRSDDVCNPQPFIDAMAMLPMIKGVSTFGGRNVPKNVTILRDAKTQVIPHAQMMRYVKRAGVYVSTTPETGDIGSREALAAGVPVVALAQGAITEFLTHKVTGYLANTVEELAFGIQWCLDNREMLQANIALMRPSLDWTHSIAKMAKVLTPTPKPSVKVSVIIPCYNYGDFVHQAILSVAMQKPSFQFEIIVIDDGSTDNSRERILATLETARTNPNVKSAILLEQENKGVSQARNLGLYNANGEYAICLDADDMLADKALEILANALDRNKQLGIVYTAMQIIEGEVSDFPPQGEIRYTKQFQGFNQIPTCAMFRLEDAKRVDGYRTWHGVAGEDADFFTRMILHTGKRAARVSNMALFLHRVHDSHYWGKPDRFRQRGLSPIAAHEPMAMPNEIVVQNTHSVQYKNPVKHYHQPLLVVYIEGYENILDTLDSLEAWGFYRWVAVSDYFDRPSFAPFLTKQTLEEAKELAPWLIILKSGTLIDDKITLDGNCQKWNKKTKGVIMCACAKKKPEYDPAWIAQQFANGDYIEATYTGVHQPNGVVLQGEEVIISAYAKSTKQKLANNRQDYGKRSPNEVFLVHREDIRLEPFKYVPVPESQGDNVPYTPMTIYEV